MSPSVPGAPPRWYWCAMQRLLTSFVSLAALATSARAQPAPDAQPPAAPASDQPATLAQPEPAAPPEPASAETKPAPAEAKPASAPAQQLTTTLYGFVETDAIWDTTQGLGDVAGNAAIARPGTYAGEHGQATFGARNSRVGLRFGGLTYHDVKVSGQIEMDFLGNQPPGTSEAALFQNPTLRYRHANLKLETPVVDILAGQSWQLFGWQPLTQLATVQIQGVPGQVYSRAPQIRVSKRIQSGSVSIDLAAAAARPPQRASSTPDGHAGIKLSYDPLKAFHTAGGTGSALDSAAVGVSVVGRRFAVNELAATPQSEVVRYGYGLSVNALVPIVPATKESRANALTLVGDFVTGAGIADLYTGLTGGVSQPALPATPPGPPPAFTANVDNGLVIFRPDGTLHPVQWTSFVVGAQYYLPPSGKIWLSANYSYLHSANAHALGDPKKGFDTLKWADGNVFFEVTPVVRFGVDVAWFDQTYADDTDATNLRVQGSAYLVF